MPYRSEISSSYALADWNYADFQLDTIVFFPGTEGSNSTIDDLLPPPAIEPWKINLLDTFFDRLATDPYTGPIMDQFDAAWDEDDLIPFTTYLDLSGQLISALTTSIQAGNFDAFIADYRFSESVAWLQQNEDFGAFFAAHADIF